MRTGAEILFVTAVGRVDLGLEAFGHDTEAVAVDGVVGEYEALVKFLSHGFAFLWFDAKKAIRCCGIKDTALLHLMQHWRGALGVYRKT